ncbi:DUF1311 domain-containing protein [Bradyrhizobium diazoefficiens]|uniref:lysozyme inhibitor LprI family protein n=1 Tax=Bradyrhizobium diazoefficiens TaxID=1355477 RepID=UPI0019095E5B|nr:SH3 domain-containing protein [Bradyrhizobium diazoefficiens]MBK3666262.1 DUF1311 domain-containing protein [Bradyrhizobium diazoefficiens]
MRLITIAGLLVSLSLPAVLAQQPPSQLGLACSSEDQQYPLGRWVCNDRETAQLSKQLNAAYRAAQTRADQAGRAQLQQANAAWLSAMDERCAQDRSKSCVTSALKERLKQLGVAVQPSAPAAPPLPGTAKVDAFAFCRSARNLDDVGNVTPDPSSEEAMAAASATNSFVWRCMDGAVWVCGTGASGGACQRMGPGLTPTNAITSFCLRSPNSDFVPMSVIGNSPASWKCVGTAPQVLQAMRLDKRHFMAGSWIKVVQPSPSVANQSVIAAQPVAPSQDDSENNLAYVANTQPPDVFLSLRSEPGGTAGHRMMKMANGTRLRVLKKQTDGWWYVQVLPGGQIGWGLSALNGKQWVECCTNPTSQTQERNQAPEAVVRPVLLSQGELDAFRKVMAGWQPSPGTPAFDVHFKLQRDGMIDGTPDVLSTGKIAPDVTAPALALLQRAQPFKMFKPETYEAWKDIVVTFEAQSSHTQPMR